MFKLPDFLLNLMADTYLGDVDIKFTNARTKGNKLLLATEIDFPGATFWLMQGELSIDLNDGSVSYIEDDQPDLIVTVINAASIEELPSMQVCESKFVRWLAELKMEELRKNG